MFCIYCGAEIEDGKKFCTKCGAPVDGQDAEDGQPTDEVGSGRPLGETPKTDSVSSPLPLGAEATTGYKPEKKMKKGVVVGIVAAVVIIGAGAAFFFAKSSGMLDVSSPASESAPASDAAASPASTDQASTSAATTGVEVKNSLEDYSWDEISQISDEISKSGSQSAAIEIAKKYHLCSSDGSLEALQTKKFSLSDGTSVKAEIIGFYHDDKSDGSGKAGITFMTADAVAMHSMNAGSTNSGGWESSALRAWASTTLFQSLPADLSAKVVAVDKMTNNVGATPSATSVTKTSDKLWIPSLVELAGSVNASDFEGDSYVVNIYNAEGTKYQLFDETAAYFQQTNGVLVKSFLGGGIDWWCRSSVPSDSKSYRLVIGGNPGGLTDATDSKGVVMCFCV